MSQKTFCDKMFECNRLSVLCWLVFYLILLALTKDSADAQEIRSPAPEFNRHRVVTPVVHHARTKREITSTRHSEGLHQPEVTMTINIDGEDHVLDLRLNKDLVAGDHIISYQKDGETVIHKPKIEELDICQYSGKVRGKKGSWVAVSTCNGVRGIIHDGKQMRYIEPQGNKIDENHYVYDHSDLNTDFHCGYSGGVTNNTDYDRELMKEYLNEKSRKSTRINRYKRNADDTELRGPFNANKLSRYVELVLVADNREYRANGESITTIHRQLKDVANIINSVYTPLNIFIALVGVVVWTERDEIILEEDGDKTLTHFLHYRRNRLLQVIPNDNAHLLTRQKFNGGVVGKALKGPICTYQFSGGVATNHSEVIGLVATTIAHEMGHNFGMEHDTEADCTCPDDKCIMSPSSTSVTPTHWSSCSLRSLALSFERGMDYCLRNKPKRLFDSPTCGNGFVEPGEQCDCGLNGSPACLACCQDCVLRSNATCAIGECCDPETCRPKSAGAVCRAADRECDLPEYCSGYSEFCPRDVHKMDATPCADNEAYCVRGSCRTHTDQCRLLWGSTGSMSDVRCYISSNVKGDKKGNCGYERGEQPVYHKCAPADALCGLLQCKHLNERLEFGMESVSTLSAVFINNNGTILTCRTAMIDLGLSEVDPGMVPDGAKCGDEKMCYNQKCVPVASFMQDVAQKPSSVCPSNCSGHGVCNSEGHCHCEPGFAPPLCALPGPGGSIDSGPATDSSIQRNFMVAMYVIFLGILPSILLIMFLMYYSKQNVISWWKTPRKSYVPKMFNNSLFSKNPKTKSNFNFNLSSFSNSSSFIRLLSFKRNDKNSTETNSTKKCPESQTSNENFDNDNEYVNCDLNLNTNKIVKNNKLINLIHRDEQKKQTVKKIHRKINKEDIKVASDDVAVRTLDPNVELKTDIKKNNIVIINTGLASTTNKNISENDLKPTLNTIDKTNISTRYQEKPKVNSSIKNKNNLIIVNAGLTSTTNNKIKPTDIKTNNLNNKSDIQRTNFKDLQSKFNQQSGVKINLETPKC